MAYARAARYLGASLFEHNIRLCLRKLSTPEPPIHSDNFATASHSLINNFFDAVFWVRDPNSSGELFAPAVQFDAAGVQVVPVELTASGSNFLGGQGRSLDADARDAIAASEPVPLQYANVEQAFCSLYEQARTRGARAILILRGDVELCCSFATQLAFLMSSVPPDWQVVSLAWPGGVPYQWTQEQLLSGYVRCPCPSLRQFRALAVRVRENLPQASAGAGVKSADYAPHLASIFSQGGRCYSACPPLIRDAGEPSDRDKRQMSSPALANSVNAVQFRTRHRLPVVGVQLAPEQREFDIERLCKECAPFVDLRLFRDSRDGLRPVHPPEPGGWRASSTASTPGAGHALGMDFLTAADPEVELRSEIIREFLRHQLFARPAPVGLRPAGYVAARCRRGWVSIIIPTFKRAGRLADALRSVLSQDYARKEIIVVSDNDPEGQHAEEAAAVVDKMRNEHPHIRLLFTQHARRRNAAAARNTGFLNASGEYICFLDDDDVYLPGRLSTAVALLQVSAEEIGAVYCGYLGWNSSQNDLARYPQGDLSRKIMSLNYASHYVHTDTVTYRRSALEILNGFDESFERHQDLELNLRFFSRYKMAAAPTLGVHLNPAGKQAQNDVHNLERFELKEKFFRKFSEIFESFDPETQSLIIERHFNDTMRYVSNKKRALEYLKSRRNSLVLGIFYEKLARVS